MAALRPLPARKVVRALQSLGFSELRQRGSHLVMGHSDGRRVVIPIHPGEEIGRGLLRKIIFISGVEPEEFLRRT